MVLISLKNHLTFDQVRVLLSMQLVAQQPKSSSNQPDTDRLSIRPDKYPKFSGKQSDWPKFYKGFTSLANIEGWGSLLDTTSGLKITPDSKLSKQNNLLYSVLRWCCRGGLALPKVKEFDNTKDGHTAWCRLYNHYYGGGNLQHYMKTMWDQLLHLELTLNSVGGAEKYISNFEDLCL